MLKAWHLVEALAPSEVTGKGEVLEKHYFKDNKNRSRTRLVKLNENPWKSDKVKLHSVGVFWYSPTDC